MKKRFLNNVTFTNLARWWLTFILLFLPFQHILSMISRKFLIDELSTFLDRLDEITIVIFLPMAIREFFKNEKKPDKIYFILLAPILALSIHGIVSGMVNGNYILATFHGTFTYVKYFFIIFIYAAFFREFSDFKRVFRLILIIAIFLGVVAFIQEAWAMSDRYILQKNLKDVFYFKISYLLNLEAKSQIDHWYSWRAGLLRAPSLMINANFSGLYLLLILVIYMHVVKKVNSAVFVSLFSGILGSVSRVVYTCFVLVGGIHILKGKKWLIVSLIPIMIILFYLSPLTKYTISKSILEKPPAVKNEMYYHELGKEGWDYIRSHAREKGIEIWKDNILLGVGPGMYGGAISIKYNSPVYEKYGFDLLRKKTIEKWKTIDQFWVQVLAELGIIGIMCFAWFFISLAKILFILKNKASSNEKEGLFMGLITFIIIILIYTYAYDMNVPPIIFTYFAFVGMGLSCGIRTCEK